MKSKFIRAVLLQFSGIMGAGIFALPYFLYHSNFWGAVVGMLVVAVIIGTVNVFYVQVICNTDGDHQLPGYAQKYLGNNFKKLATASLVVSALGVVLAYIKFGSNFLQILFPIGNFLAVVIFLLLIIGFYLLKIKKLKIILDYLPFVTIIMAIWLFGRVLTTPLPQIELQSFSLAFFGVVVFSLSGL